MERLLQRILPFDLSSSDMAKVKLYKLGTRPSKFRNYRDNSVNQANRHHVPSKRSLAKMEAILGVEATMRDGDERFHWNLYDADFREIHVCGREGLYWGMYGDLSLIRELFPNSATPTEVRISDGRPIYDEHSIYNRPEYAKGTRWKRVTMAVIAELPC